MSEDIYRVCPISDTYLSKLTIDSDVDIGLIRKYISKFVVTFIRNVNKYCEEIYFIMAHKYLNLIKQVLVHSLDISY